MARGRTYDLVIEGGTLIYGLRTPHDRAHIGIAGGRIVETGGNIPVTNAERVIDAAGKIVLQNVCQLTLA